VIRLITSAGALLIVHVGELVADAAPAERGEAWRTSPYHGMLNGAGQPIPCRCRYRDRSYNLGDKVCLQMPDGVVLARCDMFQNNTSWVATDEACTLSSQRGPTAPRQSFAKLSVQTILTAR
jgi:hypothetical protein